MIFAKFTKNTAVSDKKQPRPEKARPAGGGVCVCDGDQMESERIILHILYCLGRLGGRGRIVCGSLELLHDREDEGGRQKADGNKDAP